MDMKEVDVIYTQNIIYSYTKRITDIIGGLIGTIFLFLPTYIIIFLFKLFTSDKNSILFKQKRIGKGGKIFHIYKFQSMVENAEEILRRNEELYKKYQENNFKLEPHEDPRITKFGRFIRKTSIDEIPQFINVLKGDMSLVGPRPIVQKELDEYQNHKNDFLSVKPGITGYWQTSGRSEVGYPERVNIELYYIVNQSFMLDIKIIFKTILKIFFKEGAY